MTPPPSPGFELALIIGLLLEPLLGPVLTAKIGPLIAPTVLIVFGAVAGSVWTMSKAETDGRWSGVRYVFVGVLLAMTITSFSAWMVEFFFKIPTSVALMPLAALIGARRDALLDLIDTAIGACKVWLKSFKGGTQNDQ